MYVAYCYRYLQCKPLEAVMSTLPRSPTPSSPPPPRSRGSRSSLFVWAARSVGGRGAFLHRRPRPPRRRGRPRAPDRRQKKQRIFEQQRGEPLLARAEVLEPALLHARALHVVELAHPAHRARHGGELPLA